MTPLLHHNLKLVAPGNAAAHPSAGFQRHQRRGDTSVGGSYEDVLVIWPLPGVPGSRLLHALQDVATGASNIYSHGSDRAAVIDSYLKWVSDSVATLRLLVAPDDLRRLVLTDTYRSVLPMANPSAAPPLMRAIHDEISARQHDTEAAFEQVKVLLLSWQPASDTALVVPDTNVLLHHDKEFQHVAWHDVISTQVRALDTICVVLPLVVIDELDDQKRADTRTRARRALKTIYASFEHSTDGTATLADSSSTQGAVQLRLLLDSPGHVRLPRPDDELIDRASTLQSLLDQQVNLVTYDTGAALRAAAAGLRPHRLAHSDDA